MSSHSNLDLAAVLGFGAGIYWFFKGFQVFRKYRVLADTPETPIRSIAMGLVEIRGKAIGDDRVSSPVTRTPCLFYKVDIERWESDSRGRGHWARYRTDADGATFALEDATGKVLVDAHGAEFELIQTERREITSGIARGFLSMFDEKDCTPMPGLPATDEELVAYVSRVTAGVRTALFQGLNLSPREVDLTSPEGVHGEAQSGVKILKQAALEGSPHWGGSSSSGRFRLTEYCILADHWYDVTGTCAENPSAQDENDRNIVIKGKNEPTFLITWRTEKGIEGMLRNRSLKYVFGGGILSVVCLTFLLLRLGWL
jgi:hypothetical protein